MRPSMTLLAICLSSNVRAALSAQSGAVRTPSDQTVASPEKAQRHPPYVKKFFDGDPKNWAESFRKLTAEQQVEIGIAGFGHEPSTAHWIEVAVDNRREEVIQILLRRLDQAQSRSTIDPLLLAMDFAVKRMPMAFLLSKTDYLRCEEAATRVPQLGRKAVIDDELKRLKGRTAL